MYKGEKRLLCHLFIIKKSNIHIRGAVRKNQFIKKNQTFILQTILWGDTRKASLAPTVAIQNNM